MAGGELEPKPVSASHVTLVQLMEITDANIAGIVHGGTIMKLVDTAAGLPAGSTSYYVRTRGALLGAIVRRLAEAVA